MGKKKEVIGKMRLARFSAAAQFASMLRDQARALGKRWVLCPSGLL
jgi:hypothetical protein